MDFMALVGGVNVGKTLERSAVIRKALEDEGIDTRPMVGGALPGGVIVPLGRGVEASIATHDFATGGQLAEICLRTDADVIYDEAVGYGDVKRFNSVQKIVADCVMLKGHFNQQPE